MALSNQINGCIVIDHVGKSDIVVRTIQCRRNNHDIITIINGWVSYQPCAAAQKQKPYRFVSERTTLAKLKGTPGPCYKNIK